MSSDEYVCVRCSFATTEHNGVLFYNGRYNERHDFVALEIIDDHVQFSFSLGTDVTRVAAFPPPGVRLSDGNWHQVTVSYLNRVSCCCCSPVLPLTNYLLPQLGGGNVLNLSVC